MVREWLDIRNLISTRRMQHQGRSLPSASSNAQDLHPALRIFRAVAARNSDRARRRCVRECGQMEAQNADSLEAGDVLPEPSDDEAVLADPADIQWAHTIPF